MFTFFNFKGVIWIGSSDFRRKFCEHDAQCLSPAVQLVWCASGAVVLNLGSVLLVLSPSRDNFTLILDSHSHVHPEVDGLRIITNRSHEFLEKVPLPNQEIFRIGSMSPGAILVEVWKFCSFFQCNYTTSILFRLRESFKNEVIALKSTFD